MELSGRGRLSALRTPSSAAHASPSPDISATPRATAGHHCTKRGSETAAQPLGRDSDDGEFLAFWLRDGAVVAGVNVNVFDRAREDGRSLPPSGGRCRPERPRHAARFGRGAQANEPLDSITSVASFFLSRIDTKVDAQLPADSALRGTVALASARVAYHRYLANFAGPEWDALERAGAKRQRPLWASAGTKDPRYSDVLYVSS